MKTYKEKTQSVFQKIEEAEAIRKKRVRKIKRIAAPVFSLCLVTVIGFGTWKSGILQSTTLIPGPNESGVPVPNPNGTIQRVEEPDVYPEHPILKPGDEGYIEPGSDPIRTIPAVDIESGINISKGDILTQWANKTVNMDLANALNAATANEVFDIIARPYIDFKFVYNGKTLADYYNESCYERNLPEILSQLLKEGDSLKYGTALFEGSAPNGEKWDRSFYEERISFYGTSILEKYIVDGEFLQKKVENDLEIAKNTKDATKAYKEAYAAYYQHLVDALQASIPADVKETNVIVLHVTAEEFRAFTADHIEAWSFNSLNTQQTVDDSEKIHNAN